MHKNIIMYIVKFYYINYTFTWQNKNKNLGKKRVIIKTYL
jgi:hypothetical protein